MNEARNAILARLNKQINTGNSKRDQLISTQTKALNTKQTFDQLTEKLKENRAEVYRVSSKNWIDTLTQIALEKKLNTWLIGGNLRTIEQAGKALTEASPEISLVHYSQSYESLKKTLFHEIDASVTLAKAAIADTGTLILIPDKNEPRMMSLVPPVHVVILKEQDVVGSFQQLVDHPPWSIQNMPSNIVFISSPSKTADIQQTLAYGAHGPKNLIVLILS